MTQIVRFSGFFLLWGIFLVSSLFFLYSITEKQWYFLYVSPFLVCVYGSGLSFLA